MTGSRKYLVPGTMALVGAAAGVIVSMAATSSAAPARLVVTPSASYLRGGYLLADGKCPKGTVSVNAEVRAITNARSGHSTFGLCSIK